MGCLFFSILHEQEVSWYPFITRGCWRALDAYFFNHILDWTVRPLFLLKKVENGCPELGS